VLNTVAASPETSVLTLRWFLENVEIRKKSMDILHNIVLKLLCKKRRWGETEALWGEMLQDGVHAHLLSHEGVHGCRIQARHLHPRLTHPVLWQSKAN
jgi:pentatricopeptide repeat protein